MTNASEHPMTSATHHTKPELVIFDLDGTLIDSVQSIAESMNVALEALALPTHPVERYLRFVGDGVGKLAERAANTLDPTVLGPLLLHYRDEYARRELHACVYDGIAAVLDTCVEQRIAMAILSNKPEANTQRIAQAILGRWTFVAIRGERDGVPRKPDPTAARLIMEARHAAAQRCWFVGDTPMDVHTALGAGMCAVGVLWGFRSRHELAQAGATHIVASPQELQLLLRG
jgi:phosphoglycolate phosphatase